MKTNLLQSSLLAAVLLALPAVVQAQFNYTTNDGAITITGYTGLGGNVTIPDTINGLSVTSIGDGAFYGDALTNVTIPNSVTGIGSSAFEDCPLTRVTIGNGVTIIGSAAFEGCSILSLTIPDSVIVIGDYAFFGNSMTRVTIPNCVTDIGEGAFLNCYDLTYVTIGNSVTNIGLNAFSGWAGPLNLISVLFTGNAPAVGLGTFEWYTPLGGRAGLDHATIFYLPNTTGWSNTVAGLSTVMLNGPPEFGETDGGWDYASDGVQVIITRYTGSDDTVTIPATIDGMPVTAIAGGAFNWNGDYGNYFLFSVTIPAGIGTIGTEAFAYCYDLFSVYFKGNAPINADESAFLDDYPTLYYLPGTLGWSNTLADLPTALWYLPEPLILSQGPGLSVQSNQFGFTISWATNAAVVVEATTNMFTPEWVSLSTNTLVNGASYFSDPQPANLPARIYRLRSP